MPFWLFFLSAQLFSQESLLKKGLMCKLPERYQRTVVGVDPIEGMIVRGKWISPHDGQTVTFTDGHKETWQSIESDTSGWFSQEGLRNSYVYFTLDSPKAQTMMLYAMGHEMVYVNGIPRTGNRYQDTESFESWAPHFDYARIPIRLRAGKNELLFLGGRTGLLKVKLYPPKAAAFFNDRDMTLPDARVGEAIEAWGAIVVVNADTKPLQNASIQTMLDGQQGLATPVPLIQPLSVRKVAFRLQRGSPVSGQMADVQLDLVQENGQRRMDRVEFQIANRKPDETYRRTFISEIDGSVQYYAVHPAQDGDRPAALVLSVHGAGVEAINQVNAYSSKTWAHIVAPTNRRPYGFNWEDWGRLDALEVLEQAQKTLSIDPERVYLTGHSMGGHGVWILGALYPDQFAVLGPSAGWISFWTYRVREEIGNQAPIQELMKRVNQPSKTFDLMPNYENLGLYILHGDKDDNVLVTQSRQMVERLEKFHKDYIYHEQPDAGHWWDNSPEPGADCVDWPPMFDFMARHCRPLAKRLRIASFLTPNPGISSQYYWLGLEAQEKQLALSSAHIEWDPGQNLFFGHTSNVARLSLDLRIGDKSRPVSVRLDSQTIAAGAANGKKLYLEKNGGHWALAAEPSPEMKGPHRYGTFKDAFRHRMILVYGTKGSKDENEWAFNKARYDAEQFWYQGNGSVQVVSDREWQPKGDPDRNVILYGNADTNGLWAELLAASPVQVHHGAVRIAARTLNGSEYAALFIRPRPGSRIACVAAVTGTGLTGMKLTNLRPYMFPGYAFPDCLIFDPAVIQKGTDGITAAGFFGLDWSVEHGEWAWNN
jgi:pimeloyl-ACP methyl ester carboxylesterase